MVKLREMNHLEYLEYKDIVVKELADALVEGGFSESRNSLDQAVKEQDTVLPNDEKTDNNYLYIIENKNMDSVGYIWFGELEIENEKIAYLFDIMIKEEYRNKEYGYCSIIDIEEKIKKLGYRKIQLYVLIKNEAARNLYKKCGYTKINGNEKGEKLEKIL